MFAKYNTPNAAAWSTFIGIFAGILVSYVAISFPELREGRFYLDTQLLSNLALVGFMVLGYSAWENRELLRV